MRTHSDFRLAPAGALPIAVLLGASYPRVEAHAERGLELDTILGLFFGCEGRGALGLAFS